MEYVGSAISSFSILLGVLTSLYINRLHDIYELIRRETTATGIEMKKYKKQAKDLQDSLSLYSKTFYIIAIVLFPVDLYFIAMVLEDIKHITMSNLLPTLVSVLYNPATTLFLGIIMLQIYCVIMPRNISKSKNKINKFLKALGAQ